MPRTRTLLAIALTLAAILAVACLGFLFADAPRADGAASVPPVDDAAPPPAPAPGEPPVGVAAATTPRSLAGSAPAVAEALLTRVTLEPLEPERADGEPMLVEARANVAFSIEPAGASTTATFISGLNLGTRVSSSKRSAKCFPGLGTLRIESRSRNPYFRTVVLASPTTTFEERWDSSSVAISGSVVDEQGMPIENARVEADASSVATDALGEFTTPVVPGMVPIDVTATGFERRRVVVDVRRPPPGGTAPRVAATLRRGRTVRANLRRTDRLEGFVQVLLLPRSASSGQTYPFDRFGVATVREDQVGAVFEGVPIAESFVVRVVADGGAADPPLREIRPAPTADPLVLDFLVFPHSPLRGRIVSKGVPVKGAWVRVESNDVVAASESLVEESGGLAKVAIPILPPVRRRMLTREDGRFALEGHDLIRPATLFADAPHHGFVTLPLPSAEGGDLGDLEVETSAAASSLVFAFERRARRRVSLTIDRAESERTLGDGEELRLEGLASSRYRVRVVDDGRRAIDQSVEIPASEAIRVPQRAR